MTTEQSTVSSFTVKTSLTLTDGSDLHLLDSFKLWAEAALSWFFFTERSVYVPDPDRHSGKFVRKMVKQRLVNKAVHHPSPRWS